MSHHHHHHPKHGFEDIRSRNLTTAFLCAINSPALHVFLLNSKLSCLLIGPRLRGSTYQIGQKKQLTRKAQPLPHYTALYRTIEG